MKDVSQLVKKWSSIEGKMSVKSIQDQYVKENMSVLLDNQEMKDLKRELLGEASQGSTTSIVSQTHAGLDGAFQPISLALVRRTYPELFANKIVGVQALTTPVGLAYALRVLYKGTDVEAGLDNVPAFSGFTGSTKGVSGTADAGTGVVTSAGEAWGINVTAAQSAAGVMPELTLKLDKTAIEAKTRKLAASFSLEAAMDIKAMHGIDIEREMVNVLQYEVQAELDREIVAACKSVATTGTTLDLSAVDGRWSQEKFANIANKIIYEANAIGARTRRGVGNFVVVSTKVATALQSLTNGTFTATNVDVNASNTFAQIGMLNGTITVYRDTYNTSDEVLVGYKGPGVSDAGIIFSPYVTGLFNRAMAQEDFTPRVGVMSRYAITSSLLGANRYYTKFSVSNLSTVI